MIKACKKYGLKEPRLICEPGRSLVATPWSDALYGGILKTLPGIRKYVAIDGGMSDNIRTALYHAEYEPVIANKAGQPRTEIVTLCGKHCESGDAVALDASIQHPDLGDIVCDLDRSLLPLHVKQLQWPASSWYCVRKRWGCSSCYAS